jgi:GNAT superfamily N-acetyltransferase
MSDTAFPIKRCNGSDVPDLAQLLDTVFQIQNPAKYDLLCWKFFANWHRGQTVMYAALNEAGDFISQYANFPITLAHHGERIESMICADMATHPDYRGRGLISQLARRVYADVAQGGYALSLGFSNDAGIKVDRNASGYGYQIVGKFQRYLKPNLPHYRSEFHLTRVKWFDLLPSFTIPPYIQVEKSLAYLNWRYVEKPCNDYRIYRLERGQTCVGYVVTRETRTHAYLYDIIANPGDSEAILSSVQHYLFGAGIPLSIVYILNNEQWQTLLRGWLPLPESRHRVNYYLTVKAHNHEASNTRSISAPDSWWLMAGDIL